MPPLRIPSAIIAPGAVEAAGEEAHRLGCRKALLVTDPTLSRLGQAERVRANLSASGIETTLFDRIDSEPTEAHVAACRELQKAKACDSIVALGGGSVLDAAKAVAVLARNSGSVFDLAAEGRALYPGLPLLAIPTTAGSGSEATPALTVGNPEKEIQMEISSPHLLPAAAICDATLTQTLPQALTAATGFDALCHCIEAYVSPFANSVTDPLCLAGIRLIARNLRRAWANGNNLECRSRMMEAAFMGGICAANCGNGLAHAMALPVCGAFGLPHSLTIAALLPATMEFCAPADPTRFAEIASALGEKVVGLADMQAAAAGVASVRSLARELGLPNFFALGVPRARFDKMAAELGASALTRCAAVQRQATPHEIAALYFRM